MSRSALALLPSLVLSACATSSQLKIDRAEVFELRREVKELQESLDSSRRELALVKASLEALKEKPQKADVPPPPHAAPSTKAAPAVTEDSRRSSQQHYLSGVVYFQKGDYEKARAEWMMSSELDPGNEDPKAGLKRIKQLYGDR